MTRVTMSAVVAVVAMLGCAGGSVRETSARVGAAGASLSTGGVRLEVPPGALKQEIEVRLRETRLGEVTRVESSRAAPRWICGRSSRWRSSPAGTSPA